MPRPTQQELENLIKLFRAARDQLLDTVVSYPGVGTKVYANTILQQLERQLKKLEKQSAFYVRSVIPKEYQKALDDTYTYFQKNNLQMKPPAAFAQLHNDAIYEIAREMQYQIGQGLEQAGRQILRYVESARDDALRMAGLEAVGEKLSSGSTVRQMQQNMINKLQNEGFMTVQYGEGTRAYQVSLDSYASMVARSTTREAGNLARENQLTANGYDLMEITTHYPTCEICAKYQGRVYSISGKDKRFPLLASAFASGYRNIHPNCRHVAVPWVESLQEPEEIQGAIERSNRQFEDTRDQKQIDLYNRAQAKNREMRKDRYQYERYRQRLGDDAPKSFSAFRRKKNAEDMEWGILQAQYKGMGYYEKALKNEPKITVAVKSAAASSGMESAGMKYRVKSKASYLRKIRSNYTPDGTLYEVKDIIRYTLTAAPGELADKTLRNIDAFSSAGYNTSEIKNYWLNKNNPYNGINTVLTAPNGQKFEVQYHTPESFELKNGKLHNLYEKQRLIVDETDPEFIRLQNEMFDLSDKLTVPDKIKEVRMP